MELLALQSGLSALIRPELALQNDLSAVLREGRVLQGEVLQTMGGGSIVIGIGTHRVPAQAQVNLELGQRFLFQVELEGGTTVLRILAGSQGGELALLQALRSVVGQDLPLGALLGELRQSLLASGPAIQPGSVLDGLLAQLSQHVFEPGESGAALRDQLRTGGLMFESRLREASLRSLERPELGRLVKALGSSFLTELARGAGAGGPVDPKALGSELRAAILTLLGPGADPDTLRPLNGRQLEALLSEALARALRGSGAHGLEGAVAALAGLDLPSTGAAARQILLAALLGWDPSAVLGGAGPTAARTGLKALVGDLKAHLLRALAEVPEGPERQAVAKALAGIEAEQLLNLARRETGEPMHWSLPVPDGEGWTTAHLFVRRDSEGQERGEDAQESHRLTISVDFSHTGPVRADLVLRAGVLTMRILVAEQAVFERAQAALGDLEQALASGGRRVQLALALGTLESLAVDSGLHDIRFLREHHMMDLRG